MQLDPSVGYLILNTGYSVIIMRKKQSFTICQKERNERKKERKKSLIHCDGSYYFMLKENLKNSNEAQ